MFAAIPINLAVVTHDKKLVVVRRSENVAEGPGLFNSSVDESILLTEDVNRDGLIDYEMAARRGLYEELGIRSDQVEHVRFTAIGYARRVHQYTAIGHAMLKITYEKLTEQLEVARDASFEVARNDDGGLEVYCVDHTPGGFSAFLTTHLSPEKQITSFGLACFLISLRARGWPWQDIEQAFRGRFFKEGKFIAM